MTILLNNFEDSLEGPFVTSFFLFFFVLFVLLEFGVEFIDGVVSKMHVEVFQVLLSWRTIVFCGKSCESLIVDIYSERVHSIQKHVDSKIKFEIINQVRFMDVSLDNATILETGFKDIFEVPCQEYSFTLRESFWLHNVSFLLSIRRLFRIFLPRYSRLLKLTSKVQHLRW